MMRRRLAVVTSLVYVVRRNTTHMKMERRMELFSHTPGISFSSFFPRRLRKPDFWCQIGHFSCSREARNMDARYLSLNQPFLFAVARPEIWMPDIWPWIGHFHCCYEARNIESDIWSHNGNFHCRRQARNVDARYFASNRPFLLLFVRPEIWTSDIWPRIGGFYCRREARNLDARFLAENRPFFLLFWGQKSFFIAIARPEILTQIPFSFIFRHHHHHWSIHRSIDSMDFD